MNVWPPNPGSTVMIRMMSRSALYGASASSGVPGSNSQAGRTAGGLDGTQGRFEGSSISTWKVIESQPASMYSSM